MPTGEAAAQPLWVDFDRQIELEVHGARIASDRGLLACRKLDDAFALTDMAIAKLLASTDMRGDSTNCRRRVLGVIRPKPSRSIPRYRGSRQGHARPGMAR